MGTRLGRRVVHFANLPIKLLVPSSFSNITEIALKTIPSATKIEIKRVLESMYGFEVEEVRTLNMDGKKKKRGGILIAKPDYKKAYVTLRNPLSISPETYPIKIIEEEKQKLIKLAQKSSIVEDAEPKTPHWLDNKKNVAKRRERWSNNLRVRVNDGADRAGGRVNDRDRAGRETTKFPWSNMKSFAR